MKRRTSLPHGSINYCRFTSQNPWIWRSNCSYSNRPMIRNRRRKCTTICVSQTNSSGPIWSTSRVRILFHLDLTTEHSSTENIEWLRHFINSSDHMAFVNRLNDPLTRARFLSLDRMPGMDRTSDCWVVMAYNSTRQLESKYS